MMGTVMEGGTGYKASVVRMVHIIWCVNLQEYNANIQWCEAMRRAIEGFYEVPVEIMGHEAFANWAHKIQEDVLGKESFEPF